MNRLEELIEKHHKTHGATTLEERNELIELLLEERELNIGPWTAKAIIDAEQHMRMVTAERCAEIAVHHVAYRVATAIATEFNLPEYVARDRPALTQLLDPIAASASREWGPSPNVAYESGRLHAAEQCARIAFDLFRDCFSDETPEGICGKITKKIIDEFGLKIDFGKLQDAKI